MTVAWLLDGETKTATVNSAGKFTGDAIGYVRFNDFLNGVCRHELDLEKSDASLAFLNGVCRHERRDEQRNSFITFLNGVCRHEHLRANTTGFDQFLNGVCRHELKSC